MGVAGDEVSRVRRRLVPFLFLLYIVAYLDRINVGFAALQMNAAIGLTPRAFATGAGIFFLSYVAFEIPSKGGVALATSGLGIVQGTAVSIAVFSIAMLGLVSMLGPFWTLATSIVRGVGAAAGIALINSVGNIGGFVGPYALGSIKEATGSFTPGFVLLGGLMACGGALALTVHPEGAGSRRR